MKLFDLVKNILNIFKVDKSLNTLNQKIIQDNQELVKKIESEKPILNTLQDKDEENKTLLENDCGQFIDKNEIKISSKNDIKILKDAKKTEINRLKDYGLIEVIDENENIGKLGCNDFDLGYNQAGHTGKQNDNADKENLNSVSNKDEVLHKVKAIKEIESRDIKNVQNESNVKLQELNQDIKQEKEQVGHYSEEKIDIIRKIEGSCLQILELHTEDVCTCYDNNLEKQIEKSSTKADYKETNLINNNHASLDTQISLFTKNNLAQGTLDLFEDLCDDATKKIVDINNDIEEIVNKVNQNTVLNQIVDVEKNKSLINISSIDVEYENTEFDINDLESYTSLLANKILQGKLIGYDLLQVAGNSEVKNKIHKDAIYNLRINYYIRNANNYLKTDLIIISLILIALDYYDGNYWNHVREVYKDLYNSLSQQKIEAKIREILSKYSSSENRYINFVIRHAITPRYFLSDFISFVFDIYKNTFKYELMDNLNEPLANVFLDLCQNYENENGYLGTKDNTYKLIKTTKDIINNVNWFSELIAYTKLVLRYIDSNYWQDRQKKLPYCEYFSNEIRTWIDKNESIFFADKKKSNVTTRQYKYIWKANFELQGHRVYLNIPNHLISSKYEPHTITVNIYEGEKLVKQFIKPEIISVMGGYQLNQIKFMLDNPLGKIRYEIVSREDTIFTSESKLYREYILFNEKHTEIFKENKYVGNVDAVIGLNSISEKIDIYHSDNKYQVGHIYVDEFESFVLDGEEIFFTLMNDSKIIGKTYEKTYIKTKNRLNPLYYEIEEINFITESNPYKLKIQVNNSISHLKNLYVKKLNNRYFCKLSLNGIINNGFNYLKISNNRDENIFSDLLFLDDSYKSHFKIENNTVQFKIESVFLNIEDNLEKFSNKNPYEFSFESEYFGYPLFLSPKVNVPIYKIDNNRWHLFHDPISIKDVDSYSEIWIEGIDFDSIKLVESKNNCTSDLKCKVQKGCRYITTEKIFQKSDNNQVSTHIFFYQGGVAVNFIQIFYKVLIDKNSFEIKYDEETNQFITNFKYYGKDDIDFEIKKNNEVVFNEQIQDNPVHIVLSNVEFFETYLVSVYGGEDDLFSLTSNKYKIYEKEVVFYSINSLVGKAFRIKKYWGEIFLQSKNEWKDRYINVRDVVSILYITEKVKDDIFKGVLSVIRNGIKETLDVDLLLTSEIKEGKFWGVMSYDGDLLLHSSVYASILIDENYANRFDMPISEYQFVLDNENSKT